MGTAADAAPAARIEVVGPDGLTPAHRRTWHRLQREADLAGDPQATNPFLAPEFALAVGACRDDVRIAVLHPDTRRTDADGTPPAAGGAVGFLAFQRGGGGAGRAIGLGLSDCQGAVLRAGTAPDAAVLLRGCGLTVWEFDHLADAQRPLRSARTAVAHPYGSPVMDVADGYPAYLAGLRERSPKFARTTLAKERRLGRDVGEVRYVHDERDPRALRTLLEWKSAQYRRTGRTDRFARPWIVALVERLFAERAAPCSGQLSVLYAGGQPVAAHFGLRSQTTLACWFPAYDPAYARYSPGLVLHLRMAEGTAGQGLARLDLGRGAKEYKDALKTGEFTVHEGEVTRRRLGAVGHRVRRAPARALRAAVTDHPGLYRPADRLLKAWGRFRS